MGGMFLASPIVHGFHDRWGATVASLGMRLGFALIGGAIGVAITQCKDSSTLGPFICWWDSAGGAFYGVFAGLAVASAIDVVGLSWEHVRVRRSDTSGLQLTPLVSVSRAEGRGGGGTLGVAGEF